MRLLFLLLIGAVAHADMPSAGSQDMGWETVGTDDGVEVYRKELPGTDVFAFKGKGIIDATLPKVANILLDDTRAPEWAEDLIVSKVVRWLHEPTDYIEYNHVGTPFVMKDRDFVSHVVVVPDVSKRSLDVTYNDVADPLAPPTDYVRGELSGSFFRLTEIDQGKRTLLEGVVVCDPKGSVPKWIVNFFQKSWPLDTFRAIRRQAFKTNVVEHPYFKKLYATGGVP